MIKKAHREVIQLSPSDSFLIVDRIKDVYDYPLHYHSELELNYISDGIGLERRIGDHTGEIKNKELVLVGPNLEHCWNQHKCVQKNIHEVTLQFSGNLFEKNFLSKNIIKPIGEMFERSVHGILFSQETAVMIGARLLGVSKLTGIDYFLEMLSILYDLAISRNQKLLSTSFAPYDKLESNLQIQKLNEFLQGNYESKITLEQVSNLLNMSSVSFNRFIKKNTGKTFVEYVNDIRITYALRFLLEKEYTISEIAHKCGFNSLANFNRIFKKSQGYTPSKYRSNFIGIKRVV
jgi:AraC-like DNA-binding protein